MNTPDHITPLPEMQNSATTVLSEQVRLVYGNGKAGALAVLLLATVLTIALWTDTLRGPLLTWLAYMILVSGGRLWLIQNYDHAPPQQADGHRWGRWYLVVLGLTSLGWASFPAFFFPQISAEARLLVIIIVLGTNAGAIPLLSALRWAVWLYVPPPVLVLVLYFFGQGDTPSLLLAGSMTLYAIIGLRSAETLYQQTLNFLQLQRTMLEEKKTTEALNAKLGEALREREQTEKQLKAGAETLASSTGRIVTSITQLLASITETATAVNQTATTVEEVKQTAYVAGQKAQKVAENGQRITSVAQTSQRTVENTIADLRRVEEQMTAIAQSVSKVSEQTQDVGDILTLVNGLTDRSQLLAVNAAIEATKAGEHGKGFTVVAQEVRHLAEQSKQATARIDAILNDINKSTRVAVATTTQGTQIVETSVRQSLQTTQAIQEFAHEVEATSQEVTLIAVSSQEQLVCMNQINEALQRIKAASAQNLEGLRHIETATQQAHGVGKALTAVLEQTEHRTHPESS